MSAECWLLVASVPFLGRVNNAVESFFGRIFWCGTVPTAAVTVIRASRSLAVVLQMVLSGGCRRECCLSNTFSISNSAYDANVGVFPLLPFLTLRMCVNRRCCCCRWWYCDGVLCFRCRLSEDVDQQKGRIVPLQVRAACRQLEAGERIASDGEAPEPSQHQGAPWPSRVYGSCRAESGLARGSSSDCSLLLL